MYNKRELKKTERKQDKRDPFKKDMIYDPRGQWDHPGENTRIPGGNITMAGVPYPVKGVPYYNGEKGSPVMMQPGQDYNFGPADYVDEFPQMQQQPSHQMPDGTWMPGEEHGEYEDMELTDDEIQKYKDGGYVVEEYDGGGATGHAHPHGEFNQQAYDDSLAMYNRGEDLYNAMLQFTEGNKRSYSAHKSNIDNALESISPTGGGYKGFTGKTDPATRYDSYMKPQSVYNVSIKSSPDVFNWPKSWGENTRANEPGGNKVDPYFTSVEEKSGMYQIDRYKKPSISNKEDWENAKPKGTLDPKKSINVNLIKQGFAKDTKTANDFKKKLWAEVNPDEEYKGTAAQNTKLNSWVFDNEEKLSVFNEKGSLTEWREKIPEAQMPDEIYGEHSFRTGDRVVNRVLRSNPEPEFTPLPTRPLTQIPNNRVDPRLAEATLPSTTKRYNTSTGKWVEGSDNRSDAEVASDKARWEWAQKNKKYGGEILELTDDEIQQYRNGGHVVEELPRAQNGIDFTGRVSPLVQRQMDIDAGIKKAQPIKQPVIHKTLPKGETTNRVATNYIGGSDLKTVSDRAAKHADDKDDKQEAAAQHFKYKNPGTSIEDARKMVQQKRTPNFLEFVTGINDGTDGWDWEGYYNRNNLGRGPRQDFVKEASDSNISFGSPENPTFGDYAGRAWDMVTNPMDAFTYSVKTGDVGNMPWNYNRMQRAGISDPMVEDNILSKGIETALTWHPASMIPMMIAQGVKDIPYTATDLKQAYESGDQDQIDKASIAAIWNTLQLSPAGKYIKPGMKTVQNVGNKVNQTWQTHRPVYKPTHLNKYNLEKNLGEMLTKAENPGQFNKGVYGLKKFPNDIVKFEKPKEVASLQGLDGYEAMNMKKLMKNVPDNQTFGKVKQQIDFPKETYEYDFDKSGLKDGPRAGQRALIMNKLQGKDPFKMTPDEFAEIQSNHIQKLYGDINTLRDQNLAFDYHNVNYKYNPETGFKVFDIAPFTDVRNNITAETDFLQEDVFGGANPFLYGDDKAMSNIKQRLQKRFATDIGFSAERAGMHPDDAQYLMNMLGDKVERSLYDLTGTGLKNGPNKSAIPNTETFKKSPTDKPEFTSFGQHMKQVMFEAKGGLKGGTKKATQEGNQWLNNWIQDPATQNKLTGLFNESKMGLVNNMSKYTDDMIRWKGSLIKQGHAEGAATINPYEVPSYLKSNMSDVALREEAAKTFVADTKVYPFTSQLKDAFQLKDQPMHGDNLGVYYPENTHSRSGAWVSRNPRYDKASKTSTGIHEGTHDWTRGNEGLNQTSEYDFINSSLRPEYQPGYKPGDHTFGPGQKSLPQNKLMDYLKDPTEVHARIMELRKHFDLKPSQKVSSTMADNILSNVSTGRTKLDPKFTMLFNSPQNFANLFNHLRVAAPIGGGIGLGLTIGDKRQDGGAIEIELSDQEIAQYRAQGYEVEEL